jgi:ankyrin repeat protein
MMATRDHKGRTAMMHQCCCEDAYETLESMFEYCEDHGFDARVNDRDDAGDTVLDFAMMVGDQSTVELLLAKGAEVLGSGYGGTTVLMKPLLGDDDLSTISEGLNKQIGDISDRRIDSCANSCLVAVLEHVVKFGTGSNGDDDVEHFAKRRRFS